MRFSKPFLVIIAILAILFAIFTARRAIATDPITDLHRLGAVELPTDSDDVRWYAQGATCLALTPPYDRKLRDFVGHTAAALRCGLTPGHD